MLLMNNVVLPKMAVKLAGIVSEGEKNAPLFLKNARKGPIIAHCRILGAILYVNTSPCKRPQEEPFLQTWLSLHFSFIILQ